MPRENDRDVAILAVRRASQLCRVVRSSLSKPSSQLVKDDLSPVTVADFGAQAITSLTLLAHGSSERIVGEETAEALRAKSAAATRDRVVEYVRKTLDGVIELDDRSKRRAAPPTATTTDTVLAAIDACNDPGGRDGRRWVLDPIDGTKGYLRGGQYAVALALMENGEITLGVLGCPALSSGDGGGSGCLFVAEKGKGVVQLPLEGAEEAPVHTSAVADPTEAAFCESVEAAHSAHERHARIAELLGVRAEPVRMDSQCKYGVVARGEAAIYLRLPRTESYREKIWDHAAGWLVVQEAGGRVTDVEGRDLDFGLGRTLDHNRGVVATNGPLHDRVLEAIRRTETPQTSPACH